MNLMDVLKKPRSKKASITKRVARGAIAKNERGGGGGGD